MRDYQIFNDEIEAINAVGLDARAVKLLAYSDGKIYRVKTVEHPESKNGWFKYFADGTHGAIFANWEIPDLKALYFPAGTKRGKRDEIFRAVKEATELRRKEEAEKKVLLEPLRLKAEKFFTDLCEPCSEHPYLAAKRVQPVDSIKVAGEDLYRSVWGKIPWQNGYFQFPCLIVPLYQGSRFRTFQVIDATGKKAFLTDLPTAGAYWVSEPAALENCDATLVIAEGVATALSVVQQSDFKALGISAMNAGNLPKVTRYLRGLLPRNNFFICADNDANGTGQRAGLEAMKLAGPFTKLFIPSFTGEQIGLYRRMTGSDKTPTDFNDLSRILSMGSDKSA